MTEFEKKEFDTDDDNTPDDADTLIAKVEQGGLEIKQKIFNYSYEAIRQDESFAKSLVKTGAQAVKTMCENLPAPDNTLETFKAKVEKADVSDPDPQNRNFTKAERNVIAMCCFVDKLCGYNGAYDNVKETLQQIASDDITYKKDDGTQDVVQLGKEVVTITDPAYGPETVKINENVSVTYDLPEGLTGGRDIAVSEIIDPETLVKSYSLFSDTASNFSQTINMNPSDKTTLETALTIGEKSYTISYQVVAGSDQKKTITIEATERTTANNETGAETLNTFTTLDQVVAATKDYFTTNGSDLNKSNRTVEENGITYTIFEHNGIRFAMETGNSSDTYAGTVKPIEGKKTPVINKTKAGDLQQELASITPGFTLQQTYNLILANECAHLIQPTTNEAESEKASLGVDETNTHLRYRLYHAAQKFDIVKTKTGGDQEMYNEYIKAYNKTMKAQTPTPGTEIKSQLTPAQAGVMKTLDNAVCTQIKANYLSDAPQYTVEAKSVSTPITIATEETGLPAGAQATVKEDGKTISIGDTERKQQAGGTYAVQTVTIEGKQYEIKPVVDQETRTVTFTAEKLSIDTPEEFEQKNEEAMGQIAELGKTMLSMGKLFENPVFQEHMQQATDNIVNDMKTANTAIEEKYPNDLAQARVDLQSLITVEGGSVKIDITKLLNNEGELTTSGKIIYESLQHACSILHKHIAEFHTKLLADKQKIAPANADTYTTKGFDILTDMLGSMTQTLGQVNNYLGSEASFISVLNYIKDDPTRIASLFDTEKKKIDSPAERFALYSPVMTLGENSKSMIDTYSLPNALANETDVTQIAGHLKEFFKNTTPITCNTEIVYFNTDQLLDQGFATRNENGTVEITPNKDQLLLDAWENQGMISGFSVSTLTRTLYNNPNCFIRSENDMRDETDAEQNTWLQSLKTTETSFTDNESRKLGNIDDLDNAIEEQVRQPSKQQALRIKVENQTPIIITHGLIGSTIEEPESKIYKVQLGNNPENLLYFSAKNFNKFMENYDDKYTRQGSNDEQTLASTQHKAEQKNLTIDQIKLFGQKYGIDTDKFTNAGGTITPIAGTQKLLFTQEEGNTVQLDMQGEKISFNLPGKEKDKTISIPFDKNNINKYFDNACIFTSQYNTLYNYRLENQDKGPKHKDHNQTQRTNQLVSLETYATELVTGQINATSLEADDSGFDTEISFDSGNVTINQFTYQDDTNLLAYTPTVSS